ncbi:MAG: hypothetical protein LBQ97_08045 [Fusobacteriaceae bacterium]|jgi:hypothetical protein|nr:hypothetical protein [Fusobacteriaceae bacterium]
MIRKTFSTLGIIVLALIFLLYFARNKLLEYTLEKKLTEAAGSQVEIGGVDFRPFSSYLSATAISVAGRGDQRIKAAAIREVKINYRLSVKEKKITVTDSSLIGVQLFTPGETGGTAPSAASVATGGETGVAGEALNEKTKDLAAAQFDDAKKKLGEIRETYKKRIDAIKQGEAWQTLKKETEGILDLKNPMKLLSLQKEDVERLKGQAKALLKEISAEKEQVRALIRQNVSKDAYQKNLEKRLRDYLVSEEGLLADFDKYLSRYLKQKYEKDLDELVYLYRESLKKVRDAREKDFQDRDSWEVLVEKLLLNVEVYGMVFSGEINDVSSRLSKNKTDVVIRLTAWEDKNNAVIEGKINLRDLQGTLSLRVPGGEFDKTPEVRNYIRGGSFSVFTDMGLTDQNIKISGSAGVRNPKFDKSALKGANDSGIPLLYEVVLPVLENLTLNDIRYSYDSGTRDLVIQSGLPQKLLAEIRKNNGAIREDLLRSLLKRNQKTVEDYGTALDREEKQAGDMIENLAGSDSDTMTKLLERLDKWSEREDVRENLKEGEKLLKNLFKKW